MLKKIADVRMRITVMWALLETHHAHRLVPPEAPRVAAKEQRRLIDKQ